MLAPRARRTSGNTPTIRSLVGVGAEAFAEAERLGRPVFVPIGRRATGAT
jgi:hypothetical protein